MSRSSWGASSSRPIPAPSYNFNPFFGHHLRGGRMNTGGDVGFKLKVDGREGDLALALQGRLQEEIDARLNRLYAVYWAAMNRVVEAGKGRLRADIIAGGFHRAQALSKTWRGNTYPSSRNSLEVAGWLYTRAGLIIEAFETATVITVTGNAQFLAIPQGPAKAIVRRLQQQKKKGLIGRDAWGRFTKDDSYVDQVASALGVDLQPIIAPDRQSGVLIAADDRTLTRTGRDAKNQNRRATVLFVLAKSATLKKRLQGRALLEQILKAFPGDFVAGLAAELPPDLRSAAR